MDSEITESQYLLAKKVISKWEEQQQIKRSKENEESLRQLRKKYEECERDGGHEYRPSGGKYSSAIQQTCVHCGKTID